MNPNPDWADQELGWRPLLQLVRRNWLAVLGVCVLTTAIAALVAFNLTPTYKAVTTLLLENRTNKTAKELQEVSDIVNPSFEYLTTQVEVVKSRDLLIKVVDRLKLYERDEFKLKDPLESKWNWRRYVPIKGEESVNLLSEADLLSAKRKSALKILMAGLTVQPVLRTQLLRVNVVSENPQVSAEIANAVTDAYLDGILEGRLESSRRASNWLTGRLQDIRTDLEKSEHSLQAFRDKQQLVSVGSERGLIEQDLTESAQKMREARRRKAELEAAYDIIDKAGGNAAQLEQIGPLMEIKLVQDAKTALIKARDDYQALDLKYGEQHPKLIVARTALQSAENSYRSQLVSASSALKNEYKLAVETERRLSESETRAKQVMHSLDQKDYELGVLGRDVQANRELYQLFLSRFKGSESTDNYADVNARVIETAVPPTLPFKPDKTLIVQLAALAGLLLGIALVWIRKQLSGLITTVEELERVSGLVQLSVLPRFGGKREGVHYLQDQKSGFAEGIRSLRTAILLSEVDEKLSCLLVTSSVPSEGKTTITQNLAASMAQMQKVLLIDADLRRPSQHKYFKGQIKPEGITDVLLGKCSIDQAIQQIEGVNFDLLVAGLHTPNPSELIGSQKFAALVEELKKKYDRILIDSPPLQAVSDSLLLSKLANAVLLVVRSELTHERILRSSVRDLQSTKSKILGAVINAVDLNRDAYHYARYYYRYGYYTQK